MTQRPKRGEQSLADAHPELAAEWHPTRNGDLTPADVSRSSMRSVWWRCAVGHEWQATVNNRERGRGCAVCGGRQVVAGYNDLGTTHPEVAAEWHPTRNGDLTPADVRPGSSRKVWWKCPVADDHEWQASIVNRTTESVRTGCAVCAGRVVVPSTSLATLHPEMAAEWHPSKNGDLTPAQVTPRVTRRVWWRCSAGHEWLAALASRTVQRTGCPYCAGKVAVPGETDLATLHPEVAAEWHPSKNGDLTPAQVRPGSSRRVWWQCIQGHEWQATATNRGRLLSGCPYCAGQRPIIGVTDLGTTHPDLAAEWHPSKNGDLTPQAVMKGTTRRVWWQCKKGHEWRTSPGGRVGCPVCSGKQVLAGYNDLATVDPELAAQWHPSKNGDLTAQAVTRMSGRRVWWLCESGHEWVSNVSNRSLGNGCPSCARTGYTPAQDGWLYLLDHNGRAMQQVGITNYPEARLATHRRNGWEVLDLRGPMAGDLAAALERAALASLARRGAHLGQRGDLDNFDGFTESWPTATLRVSSLAELVAWVQEDDR